MDLQGAHSFFLSTDMYARYNWPKRALHEGVSSRGRSLMHTKVCEGALEVTEEAKCIGFICHMDSLLDPMTCLTSPCPY